MLQESARHKHCMHCALHWLVDLRVDKGDRSNLRSLLRSIKNQTRNASFLRKRKSPKIYGTWWKYAQHTKEICPRNIALHCKLACNRVKLQILLCLLWDSAGDHDKHIQSCTTWKLLQQCYIHKWTCILGSTQSKSSTYSRRMFQRRYMFNCCARSEKEIDSRVGGRNRSLY